MSLQSTKGQSGKARYGWYDEFTAVLLDVCRQNKIKPTVRIDRISGEPDGTLSRIAPAFERLLLPKMRSPNTAAMVKRLQRSLRRLEQRVQTPSTRATPTRKLFRSGRSRYFRSCAASLAPSTGQNPPQ
jgi:hypothetical protein